MFETSGHKYHSFAVLPGEKWILAGTSAGQLSLIDLEAFTFARDVDIVGGEIEAVLVHPAFPHAFALSADHVVTIYRFDTTSSPPKFERLHSIPLRATIDPEFAGTSATGPSLSEAISCHPTELRFVTKTATNAVVEFSYDEKSFTKLWTTNCFRDGKSMIDVFYVRYLVDSPYVLATSSRGQVAVLDPKNPGQPVHTWEVGLTEAVHNAEHISGTEYLLSCDSRLVIRFDTSGKKPALLGPRLTRDHLEWVHKDISTGRFFLASWDRTVQEIDPETCESKKVCFKGPYKLRWIWTSPSRGPSVTVLQCRDGSLYKADLETGELTASLRGTPTALWSAVATSQNKVFIAGEDRSVLELTLSGKSGDVTAACERFPVECEPSSYAKRMILHKPTGNLVQGRSDGSVFLVNPKSRQSRKLVSLDSAIRDVDAPPEGFDAFACCEDGTIHRIDLEHGAIKATHRSPNDEPYWAIAYNHKRKVLVAGERGGTIRLLSPEDFSEIGRLENLDRDLGQSKLAPLLRPKRLRWMDNDTLVVAMRNVVAEVDFKTGRASALCSNEHNTLEDFDWDPTQRYMAAIGYDRMITLISLIDSTVLCRHYVDNDYPKSVLFLRPQPDRPAPYQFLVAGRTGYVYSYTISNDRIFCDRRLNDTREWPAPLELAKNASNAPR